MFDGSSQKAFAVSDQLRFRATVFVTVRSPVRSPLRFAFALCAYVHEVFDDVERVAVEVA